MGHAQGRHLCPEGAAGHHPRLHGHRLIHRQRWGTWPSLGPAGGCFHRQRWGTWPPLVPAGGCFHRKRWGTWPPLVPAGGCLHRHRWGTWPPLVPAGGCFHCHRWGTWPPFGAGWWLLSSSKMGNLAPLVAGWSLLSSSKLGDLAPLVAGWSLLSSSKLGDLAPLVPAACCFHRHRGGTWPPLVPAGGCFRRHRWGTWPPLVPAGRCFRRHRWGTWPPLVLAGGCLHRQRKSLAGAATGPWRSCLDASSKGESGWGSYRAMAQLPGCIDCAQWGLVRVDGGGAGTAACIHPCTQWGLAACTFVRSGAWRRQLHAASASAQLSPLWACTWQWRRLDALLQLCLHPNRWAPLATVAHCHCLDGPAAGGLLLFRQQLCMGAHGLSQSKGTRRTLQSQSEMAAACSLCCS